ncbi:hypothetical protein [Nonomuraea aridisoli]|uniref:hypothetical protein n=1 Tax=Nonomuraea aridisoli TaxID=2070368 RepID=UPI0011B94C04|nr:hypothetical protein [Nonomuraea aridisoli]
MKALLAALGGGGTLAAAALSSSWSIALAVLAVGMLAIAAGVIFHRSDDPTARIERLIKALRSEDRPAPSPQRARATITRPVTAARTPRARNQRQSRFVSKKRGP